LSENRSLVVGALRWRYAQTEGSTVSRHVGTVSERHYGGRSTPEYQRAFDEAKDWLHGQVL
jgi:hypothetical protein